MKKVPVVKIAAPDAVAAVEGLPFAATVAMTDVADAMRDGLLAFAASAGKCSVSCRPSTPATTARAIVS